jgi:hypothetical protein
MREDIVTMGFATWMTVGLLVDAYYHSTDPTLESFWTPWHALFYSGFTATAGWLVFVAIRRGAGVRTLLEVAPLGFRGALTGIGVFAVGGIGDAIWHTVFGVETSLDALLSPTHLLLFVGILLIVSTPARAAWLGGDDPAGFARFSPILVSLTLSATIVAFFFEYAWLIVDPFWASIPYTPGGRGELDAAHAMMGALLTTVILMTPLIAAVRRWRLPPGAVTVYLLFVNVALAVGFDNDLMAIGGVAVAGVVGDVVVAVRPQSSRLFAAAVPFVMWSLFLVSVEVFGDGVAWPPEIWGGLVFFTVLAGIAIDILLSLDAVPPGARVDEERIEPSRDAGIGT